MLEISKSFSFISSFSTKIENFKKIMVNLGKLGQIRLTNLIQIWIRFKFGFRTWAWNSHSVTNEFKNLNSSKLKKDTKDTEVWAIKFCSPPWKVGRGKCGASSDVVKVRRSEGSTEHQGSILPTLWRKALVNSSATKFY
jgi:hypothetical protein